MQQSCHSGPIFVGPAPVPWLPLAGVRPDLGKAALSQNAFGQAVGPGGCKKPRTNHRGRQLKNNTTKHLRGLCAVNGTHAWPTGQHTKATTSCCLIALCCMCIFSVP